MAFIIRCFLFFLAVIMMGSPGALALFGKKPKPEKFFDLDKNGVLNRYERELIATQKKFGWEMASSEKKKKFDNNSDFMLGPEEWERYKKSVKSKNKKPPKHKPGMRF